MAYFSHRIRWLRYFGRLRPLFRILQRRSDQGQVKKGQIFKVINVDKKGIYLDQLWLRNLMMLFVFAYDPQKSQKSHLKK